MIPSRTTKEAIKLAGAITITYGIALGAGWEKPLWAGFAVVVCSQVNLGQSLTKGLLRVLGTVLAVLAAWVVFSLYPQDRWMFMVCLSLWVGFCVYLELASKYQYFWQVAAFTSLIMWFVAGADFSASFEKSIERAQETTLGVLVYSLVALLVWPNRSQPALSGATVGLAQAQKSLCCGCFAQIRGQGASEEQEKQRSKVLQADTKLAGLIRDATSDSFEIWECRRQWQHYGHEAAEVTKSLLRLDESVVPTRGLNFPQLLPGFELFTEELERRFTQIQRLWSGEEVKERPVKLELDVALAMVELLSPFEAAALSVARTELLNLELRTRTLLASIRGLRESGGEYREYPGEAKSPWPDLLMPDPDRVSAVIRVIAGIWIAYLAYIYIPAMPGGIMIVMLTGSLGVFLVAVPQAPILVVSVCVVISLLVGSLIYFFVLPHLSSFYALGPLLFVWFFSVAYFLSAPRLALAKVLALVYTQMVVNLTNEQSYSFIGFSNLLLACVLTFCILAIAAYIPISPRPERMFSRLIGVFFTSAAYLAGQGGKTQRGGCGIFRRWLSLYHYQVIRTVPAKISLWGTEIQSRNLPGISPDQIQSMVRIITLVSDQIQSLSDGRGARKPAALPDQLAEEVAVWRSSVQQAMLDLSDTSTGARFERFRSTNEVMLNRMEAAITDVLRPQKPSLSILPGVVRFLNVLGVARHINESLVEFAEISDQVDWKILCEARFV